jgi:polar amino acid transport system substrate-binding protein
MTPRVGIARRFGVAGRTRFLAGGLLLALVAGLAPGAARADALDQIQARGMLVVGTKADYPPFGYRDDAGAIVGFEPDLARDIATALGVKLELVAVTASNRLTLLADGTLDLVIATMNDTPERRKLVDFVQPSYYASGVNVLVPKSAQLHVWQQLRGKPICTIEGAFYVPEIKARYEPEALTFKTTGEMYDALQRERCFAAVYDDTAIIGKLQSPDWRAFEMPLRSILVEPWGMATRHGETRLEKMLSDSVRDWHRTGRILALEARWNIPRSSFATEMRQKYADTP